MIPLINAQIRAFKAQAQRLKATLKIGKEGISSAHNSSPALADALNHHELVKVKFDEFKEQKKELAPQLAEKSGSHLVTRVGNVVVLYRPRPRGSSRRGGNACSQTPRIPRSWNRAQNRWRNFAGCAASVLRHICFTRRSICLHLLQQIRNIS